MISQSKYLPKQMNGPVVNSVMAALEDRLRDSKAIEDYLYSLSIETAQETELENIGRIVGYPRPLVPIGFEQENVFLFTQLPFYQDAEIGLSQVSGEVGGRLTGQDASETNYMNLGLYRKFLDKVAYIKRYGVTLYSVDRIAKLIDDDYTVEYNEDKDIVVTFAHSIGFQNLWILSTLFLKLATSPQIFIQTAIE